MGIGVLHDGWWRDSVPGVLEWREGDGATKDKCTWRPGGVRDLRFGAGDCSETRAGIAPDGGLSREHAHSGRELQFVSVLGWSAADAD